MKQFEFIGKKRMFKRIKMAQLMDMEDDIKAATESSEDNKAAFIAMGKVVENFLDPFEAEEMLEAEPDEFYLAQGLHMIATYYKHNRSKQDIDALKAKIIDAAIDQQIKSMRQGEPEPFQPKT